MFFIGVFSHLVAIIMLCLVSLSMVYYNYQGNITSKIESFFSDPQEKATTINFDNSFDKESRFQFSNSKPHCLSTIKAQDNYLIPKSISEPKMAIKAPSIGHHLYIGTRAPPC